MLVGVRQAAALLDGVGRGWGDDLLGPWGQTGGQTACLAVDLDTPGDPAGLVPPPGAPLVLVGVSDRARLPPAPAGCDVLLTAVPEAPPPWVGSDVLDGSVGAAAATLVDRIRGRPQAATTLAQILRAGAGIEVVGALVVESLAYSTLQAGPEFGAWLAGRQRESAPAPPDEPPVLVERPDATTLAVTLNRPAKRNAYNAAMRDGLADALAVAASDETIARVVVRARGPSFCAGGDLDEFGTTPDPATAHAIRTGRSVGARLAACSPRVVAYLHGHCVGAGVELPAFAGRVVADPAARFALPEVGMGLVPGAGGTASIPRRIGRQRTAWLALSGAPLPAAAARRWGLVDALEEVRPAS